MSHPVPRRAQPNHWPQHSAVDVIEDVQFMLDAGETHVEAIAGRVGMRPATMLRLLYKNGRTDLTCRVDESSCR